MSNLQQQTFVANTRIFQVFTQTPTPSLSKYPPINSNESNKIKIPIKYVSLVAQSNNEFLKCANINFSKELQLNNMSKTFCLTKKRQKIGNSPSFRRKKIERRSIEIDKNYNLNMKALNPLSTLSSLRTSELRQQKLSLTADQSRKQRYGQLLIAIFKQNGNKKVESPFFSTVYQVDFDYNKQINALTKNSFRRQLQTIKLKGKGENEQRYKNIPNKKKVNLSVDLALEKDQIGEILKKQIHHINLSPTFKKSSQMGENISVEKYKQKKNSYQNSFKNKERLTQKYYKKHKESEPLNQKQQEASHLSKRDNIQYHSLTLNPQILGRTIGIGPYFKRKRDSNVINM